MKKRYIVLCFVCFVIFLFFLVYQGTTYFRVISKYFESGEEFLEVWRDSCVAYGRPCEEVKGFLSLTKDFFYSTPGDFAYFIDHGTMAFGFLIPLLCVFSGLNFRKYLDTTFSLKAYRSKDYFHFLFTEMNSESIKTAFSVYIAYLVFFVFIIFIIQPLESTDLTRYFLTDIFGESFYLNQQKLYYLIEGTIRFFFIPYIYSFLGTVCAYIFKNKRDIIIEPLILYYGISFIMQFLIAWNINLIYIDPIAIMANSALSGFNSLLLICFPILIYLVVDHQII